MRATRRGFARSTKADADATDGALARPLPIDAGPRRHPRSGPVPLFLTIEYRRQKSPASVRRTRDALARAEPGRKQPNKELSGRRPFWPDLADPRVAFSVFLFRTPWHEKNIGNRDVTLRGRDRTTGRLNQAEAREYADAAYMVPGVAVPLSSADLCRRRDFDVLPIRRRNRWPIQWDPPLRSRDSDLGSETARKKRSFPAKTLNGREPCGVTRWTSRFFPCPALRTD